METLPSCTPLIPLPHPNPMAGTPAGSRRQHTGPHISFVLLIHSFLGTWGEYISAAGTPKLYMAWDPTL